MLYSLMLAYLTGSISPGYWLGRVVKHLDIRNYGNNNTGATNTYRIVGPAYGIAAGTFDFLKAPFAYYAAVNFFNLGADIAILAGLVAVLGHIFPIYLNFQGGRGTASLFGLSLTVSLLNPSFYALLLLLGTVIYAISISKSIKFAAPLRKMLKLAALFFPLGLLLMPRQNILYITGIILTAFIFFDILRWLFPKINKKYLSIRIFAKKKEKNYLSGASLLLAGIFLVAWLFPESIAVLSLVIFIFGDVLAPIGQSFLPYRLMKKKTLGGLVIILLVGLACGIFLNSLTSIAFPFSAIAAAAIAAALLDQLSFLLDDNLLVPLGTAVLLNLLV